MTTMTRPCPCVTEHRCSTEIASELCTCGNFWKRGKFDHKFLIEIFFLKKITFNEFTPSMFNCSYMNPSHIPRGGFRTAATSKMERF